MIFNDWWFAITSTSSSVAKRQIQKIPQRLYRVPNAQFLKQITLLIGLLAGAKKLRIGYSILGLDLAFKKASREAHVAARCHDVARHEDTREANRGSKRTTFGCVDVLMN